MLKEPPTSRQMLCFTGERGVGGGFSPMFCGVGSYQEGCAGGGVISFSPHPGRVRRWKRKKKRVAGSSGKTN